MARLAILIVCISLGLSAARPLRSRQHSAAANLLASRRSDSSSANLSQRSLLRQRSSSREPSEPAQEVHEQIEPGVGMSSACLVSSLTASVGTFS
mmetsp:Transcript_18965/g.53672  ORF Transcript_18965/g.53672 Transcript_18965/m.53672 type:complete len:95 (-) Transcript_18965:858-1142(-)